MSTTANIIDNVRIAMWLSRNGNFDHLANSSRPALNVRVDNPTDEDIVLKPGANYLPSVFVHGAETVKKQTIVWKFSLNTKAPYFSGGVKTQ